MDDHMINAEEIKALLASDIDAFGSRDGCRYEPG